ncbi:ABC transporter permease [candidate division WOR-3 bacterium]|nr:ABC transporter permease [candidate division WOR-3 bacterium]
MNKIIKKIIDRFYYLIRNRVRGILILINSIFLFIVEMIKSFEKPRILLKLTVEQMYLTGNQSLPIIIVSSAAIGLVTTFQAQFQGRGIIPDIYISTALVKATLEELGPLLTGLMLSGRVGAAMAAELGTMKVTEQIDALSAMAINPFRFLVLPRFFAVVMMTPVLTVISEAASIFAGYLLATLSMGILHETFMKGMKFSFMPIELFGGLIKAVIFGMIISLAGTFTGFHADGGAKGVGQATTKAVVSASVLILIADYLVARLVFR